MRAPRSRALRQGPRCRPRATRALALAVALFVLLWPLIAVAPRAALATVVSQDDPFALVDACVEAEMRSTGTPGASIAIARDGAIVYTKGYGLRHKESGGAIDAGTLFRIGSTTKMMTAAAVMTLVDDGAIDLDAGITQYLPDLRLPSPWEADAITAHHLLSHSSGMPDSYRLHRYVLFNRVSLDAWVRDLLPRTPMASPPGSFWSYSNPGYSLAGYLVERASGRPYEDYTAARVWRPAGMPLTTFSIDEVEAGGNFAWGHDGVRRLAPGDLPADVLGPAGTAFSTPRELVTWAQTLMAGGGDVLRPTSAAAMQASHVATDWSPWQQYGYGVFVTAYRDRDDPADIVTVYDHAGNTTGWGSELAWVPERGVAVSILSNTAASLDDSLRCALREIAGVAPRSAAGLSTPPDSWDAYTGTYAEMNQALWDATLRVTREGDRLLLHRLEEGTVTPLVSLFRATFAIDADGDGRPDSGAVTRRYTFSDGGDGGDDTVPAGGPIRWMHNRTQIAERVGQLPAAVELRGRACQYVDFRPEIDISALEIRASGLVAPGSERLPDRPLVQDDPEDPSTASFTRDLTVRGEAGLLEARIDLQAADDAGLYLLRDADEDGRFAYPDELVAVGWEGQGYRVLKATERLPAGAYQLWVQGIEVRGSGRFDLETRLVDGAQLRVSGAPPSVRAGEPVSVELCAVDVEGLDAQRVGLLEIGYGSPPRRARIPVSWSPAEPVAGDRTRIYLPLGLR